MKLLLIMTPLLALGQERSSLSARDLFYTRHTSDQPQQLVTRTVVQVDLSSRDCGAATNGERVWSNVNEARVFRGGERFRIVVEANTSGFLYVFAQQSSGGFADLIPRSGEVASITAYEDTPLPAFCVQGQPGDNILWFLVTADPQRARDFRRLLKEKADPTVAAEARIETALRVSVGGLEGRDIVVEESAEKDNRPAIYRKTARNASEQLFRIRIKQE